MLHLVELELEFLMTRLVTLIGLLQQAFFFFFFFLKLQKARKGVLLTFFFQTFQREKFLFRDFCFWERFLLPVVRQFLPASFGQGEISSFLPLEGGFSFFSLCDVMVLGFLFVIFVSFYLLFWQIRVRRECSFICLCFFSLAFALLMCFN